MGRLIKAEFRKIFSTKLWWVLLLCAVVLAIGWAAMLSAVFDGIIDDADQELRDLGVSLTDLSFHSVFLTRAINFATIFPMLFGGLALASEIGNKTITTSFLTAPNRAVLLGAKAITYVIAGAAYGIVIVLAATLGLLLGTGGDSTVSGGVWLPIAVSGITSCILWTLLGLGVGALFGTPVGTSIVLLVYGLAIGPLGDLIGAIAAEGDPTITGLLPNGAANGLTGATASSNMVDEVRDAVGNAPLDENHVEGFENAARAAAGGLGSFGLAASLALFLGWALVLFVLGMVRTQTRDIT